MGRPVFVIAVTAALALTSCSGGGTDAEELGQRPTTSRTASAATPPAEGAALSAVDQAFVDELRGIEGLTFAGSDERFRLNAELIICDGLEVSAGNWGENIAAFRRYNPEVSEQTMHDFTVVTVDYLCPEFAQ